MKAYGYVAYIQSDGDTQPVFYRCHTIGDYTRINELPKTYTDRRVNPLVLYTNKEGWFGVARKEHPFHRAVKPIDEGPVDEIWEAFLAHVRML